MIAGLLNRHGLRTGHDNRWTRERVIGLRSKHDIQRHDPARQQTEGWLNLTDAAALVGVSPKTLRLAVESDTIPADHPLTDGPWVFHRITCRDQPLKNSCSAPGTVARDPQDQLPASLLLN